MTFPITIVDNFFDKPDLIYEQLEDIEYQQTQDGAYPGERSDPLKEINPHLFNEFSFRLFGLFFDMPQGAFAMTATVQRIYPLSKEKYSKLNRGWVHTDGCTAEFGGVIYLNKNPEEDTGTDIYESLTGCQHRDFQAENLKRLHYKGELGDRKEEYEQAFDSINGHFIKTVSVQNRYNRLVLFNGKTPHAVTTLGSNFEVPRYTIAFFCQGVLGSTSPYIRAGIPG